ncbi:homoserine kinase [Geminocystis sp. NIES-3709]|uniref:homoserine kinase n=1 Tax=Geminocystis sp. NIES-3709 TaxID=1617448 RepID=UPI0005FCC046|nr:homoserine kinase [Geminocystis sp. NIES-3709]BAQ66314.1 homoserine kinase [Geminocystis sp. NIES-3709]
MDSSNSILVQVPATTANLGSGFDCIGTALSFYNEFEFSLDENKTSFTVVGDGAEKISLSEDNLLYKSFLHFYHHTGITPPYVDIKIKINVPLARGLGSSATAIVAGLLAANYYSTNKLSSSELIDLAIELEGHPDNVVPAFLGNCILSVGEKNNWQFVPINCHQDIKFILGIPDFELSTESARAVLPKQLSYHDAVYNIAHLGLLIKGLETGNENWLKEALKDKLHQPYRKSLIKGYDDIYKAVIKADGYGMVISGAGPTLLALSSSINAEKVMTGIKTTWGDLGVNADVRCLDLDTKGSTLTINND